MPNRFFIVLEPGNQLLAWNVHASRPENFPHDCGYFGKVLALVDQKMAGCSLDFVMTWRLDQVPMQGKNVVVFLIGDEKSQLPAYAGQVKAIFKTGGVKPFCPINLGSPIYSALEVLRETRNRLKRWQRRWHNGRGNVAGRLNIFPIPLGYHAQVDLPLVPMARRKWDIFFAGWIEKPQWSKPDSWRLSPRIYSRNQLGEAVARLQKTHPMIACNFETNRLRRLSPLEYSTQLANSKICLVPRGNFHETYRFLEAARAGCILISEPMPDLWYYQNHPAVVVKHWNQLETALNSILNSPERLLKLQADSIAWWQKSGCEMAVADYVVKQINNLDQPQPTAS